MKPTALLARPLFAGCLLLAHVALAQDWTHWRGPDFHGSTTATGLPDTFSKTENVKWTAAMPGPSAATPIILGDRIFVSSTDKDSQSLLALCLDRKTGKERWRQNVAP
jgi:outer membrane protein assembly factor BamB